MERQFVESMKRLYVSGKINVEKVLELSENKKITKEEQVYILNVENVKNVNFEVKPN